MCEPVPRSIHENSFWLFFSHIHSSAGSRVQSTQPASTCPRIACCASPSPLVAVLGTPPYFLMFPSPSKLLVFRMLSFAPLEAERVVLCVLSFSSLIYHCSPLALLTAAQATIIALAARPSISPFLFPFEFTHARRRDRLCTQSVFLSDSPRPSSRRPKRTPAHLR